MTPVAAKTQLSRAQSLNVKDLNSRRDAETQ